jgi:hypothetical protein
VKTVLAPGVPWYNTAKPKKEKVPKRRRARPSQIDDNFRNWLIKQGFIND